MAQIKFELKLLCMEIKAFYKTYTMLKEEYDKHSKDLLNRNVSNKKLAEYIDVFPSLVVNGCFSAELCLKYILIDSNINYSTGKKGHNLYDLYNLFSKINCKKLKNHYNKLLTLLIASIGQNEETIKKELQTLSEIYTNFRYMWSYFQNNTALGLNIGFFTIFVDTLFDYVINKISTIS